VDSTTASAQDHLTPSFSGAVARPLQLPRLAGPAFNPPETSELFLSKRLSDDGQGHLALRLIWNITMASLNQWFGQFLGGFMAYVHKKSST
jgi:hypothetical protein